MPELAKPVQCALPKPIALTCFVIRPSQAAAAYLPLSELLTDVRTTMIARPKRAKQVIERPSPPPPTVHAFVYDVELHLAVALVQAGRFETALKHLHDAVIVASHPSPTCTAGCAVPATAQIPALLWHGCALGFSGDTDGALRQFTVASRYDSANLDVLCLRAFALHQKGLHARALLDLDYVLSKHAACVCAMVFKAQCLKHIIKNPKEAAKAQQSLHQQVRKKHTKLNTKPTTRCFCL
eukprot:m.153494 g.153494  ORF g.153494 m.153494 type:complete len:239 (+) comp17473_c0_seq4:112-828(+)